MANIIKPKRTTTPGNNPTTANLAEGEIAINLADRKIFVRDTNNNILHLPGATDDLTVENTLNSNTIRGDQQISIKRTTGGPWIEIGRDTGSFDTSFQIAGYSWAGNDELSNISFQTPNSHTWLNVVLNPTAGGDTDDGNFNSTFTFGVGDQNTFNFTGPWSANYSGPATLLNNNVSNGYDVLRLELDDGALLGNTYSGAMRESVFSYLGAGTGGPTTSITANGSDTVFNSEYNYRHITEVQVNSGTLVYEGPDDPNGNNQYSVDNNSSPPSVDLSQGGNAYGAPGNGDTVDLLHGGDVIIERNYKTSDNQRIIKVSAGASDSNVGNQSRYSQLDFGLDKGYITSNNELNINVDGNHNVTVTNGYFYSVADQGQYIADSDGNQLRISSLPQIRVRPAYGDQADGLQFLRKNAFDGVNDTSVADGSESKFNFVIQSAENTGNGGQEFIVGSMTATVHSTDGNSYNISLDDYNQTGQVNSIYMNETETQFQQPIRVQNYNVANAPSSASNGAIIYVSDGDSGSPCLAVYDGSSWKRIALGATIST